LKRWIISMIGVAAGWSPICQGCGSAAVAGVASHTPAALASSPCRCRIDALVTISLLFRARKARRRFGEQPAPAEAPVA
jgi:hypothetical protein